MRQLQTWSRDIALEHHDDTWMHTHTRLAHYCLVARDVGGLFVDGREALCNAGRQNLLLQLPIDEGSFSVKCSSSDSDRCNARASEHVDREIRDTLCILNEIRIRQFSLDEVDAELRFGRVYHLVKYA